MQLTDEIIERHLVINGILVSILERLRVTTIGELLALNIDEVAELKGVGAKKIDELTNLISKARELSNGEQSEIARKSKTELLDEVYRCSRLIFVPSLLRIGFERDGITIVGDLLAISARNLAERASWGDRKIKAALSLQRLYRRLGNQGEIGLETTLSEALDESILPVPELGPCTIRQIISGEPRDLRLRGTSKAEADDLRHLLSTRFGHISIAEVLLELNWRDIPLKLSPRAVGFLDRYSLRTIREIEQLAITGEFRCPQSGSLMEALEQGNFSDTTLENIRHELNTLAQDGLERYRYGPAGPPQNARELVQRMLAFLSDREVDVLTLRGRGRTLDQVSTEYNITRERARQIESAAIKKLAAFRVVASEFIQPVKQALSESLFLRSDEAAQLLDVDERWHLSLVAIVARIRCETLKEELLSRFSITVVEALKQIVRNGFEAGTVTLSSHGVSVGSLLNLTSESTKSFLSAFEVLDEHTHEVLSNGDLRELFDTEWMRGRITSQLVEAGVNGLFFDQLELFGTVSSPVELKVLLSDSVDLLEDGRFRRSGDIYTRADEIIQILKNAEDPVDTNYIMSRSQRSWHQPVLAGQYLTRLHEIIQTGKGKYVHISKLGLEIRDIVRIGNWGSELLAGEKTQVEGQVLFELYQASDLKYPIQNASQLVSIVAKHSDVRRLSNNLQLAHRITFDESRLSLEKADPEIATQWHPSKNLPITPKEVRPNSVKEFWWRCAKGHEFKASPVYRTRMIRNCPGCQERWSLNKIRHFVRSLGEHLLAFTPAELFVIFQQSGLITRGGKAKSFVKSLVAGRFPKTEVDKFVAGEQSLVDELIGGIDPDTDSSSDELDDAHEDEIRESRDQVAADECGMATLPRVRAKAVLEAMDCQVIASTDAEAVEFLVASAKAKIWSHAYRDEHEAIEEARHFGTSDYANRVRHEFFAEFNSAKQLAIPSGYSFSIDGQLRLPNLMQRHVAVQVRDRKRFGNWSGTGAGKTLSAILSTRVCDSSLTLICCPNTVVGEADDGWASEIIRVYPDSDVQSKTWQPTWSPRITPRYLVLNFEQFQQPNSEARLKHFLDTHRVDFVVIDEVHFAKQRYADQMSERKRLLQALVSEAGTQNPDLRVLGLSATPVINNLQEGRSLIEMITGVEHDDLNVSPTVPNCMRLHQQLATLGTRWKPTYESTLALETIDIDCSEYLGEIRQLGKNHSPLELERILTRARLPKILERLTKKHRTLIYTHYVQDIDKLLYDAIRAAGYSVGFYTGDSKEGLEAFKAKKLDVLIGSSSIGTGVDGLQHVCDQLIINVLPWTSAEYEQLIGRLWRQGQVSESVQVIVPVTYANVNGERWSYCESKLQRIRYKKSIADAAVDGAVPDGNLRSPAQAQRDILAWLERLEAGKEQIITRQKIVVPLSEETDSVQRRLSQYGDFSQLNNRWNHSSSQTLHNRLIENPEEWEQYHTLYRKARESWTVVPVQEFIHWCMSRQGYTIADFGCGEALVAKAVGGKHTVHSFDHISIDESVIQGDMSSVPLEDNSVDVVIFSLSLMGSNFIEYLREARRVLKIDGHLHIWEATGRFGNLEGFVSGLEQLGFRIFTPYQRAQFTHIQGQKTEQGTHPSVDFDF